MTTNTNVIPFPSSEVITIRPSSSVIKRYNVYLEKGHNKTLLFASLTEDKAISLASQKSLLLRAPLVRYPWPVSA